MRIRSWLMAGMLAWVWGGVQAGSWAVVDAVQAPAWVERSDPQGSLRRQPLTPGMELKNHDRLLTGPGARAVVQLADGSAVKLGENATVAVNALGRRENGVFTAALDVASGAFRLTTDILRKFQTQRAINVRAGTVTAGIRGTDVWGRSDVERDFVCLLEGRIVVSHPLGEATELSGPRQYYGADKGQSPGPVAEVDEAQMAAWAAQTELQTGGGTVQREGRWAINLATVDNPSAALALYDRAHAAGYLPRIRPRKTEDGQYRYELSIGQIAGEREAASLAGRLARELELEAPLVVRPRL